MKKNFNQMIAVAMIAVSSIAFTGCYGSFSLTSKLYNWNGQVSNQKFVNELVFLGLCILPAYELCTLGDALIFNSIEFWGGQNPITMKAGDVEEGQVMYAGHPYHVTKSLNKVVVASEETAAVAEFQYFPEEESWYLMDGQNKAKVMKNTKKMMKAVAAID
ncbi:DUF3332 domain-containing protein [Butyricimonas faecalis]|jgi:hypothetical protein|uniref:DUF3332 domain-containing protein n=1 Tax=Butyricimonas faecalis TaxID=2093856 RepID=A0A3Q9IP28_9BACT|nr:DUF3332 domain-containing protein [Butyricimonas faecalis]AZS29738.1 DUF3332 domain-containing protein [Butyricimonas faecalis]MBS7154555.1 DUF3332 domain-containing protein [Sanguibacteroides justesenii]